jgi:hypothetical protein
VAKLPTKPTMTMAEFAAFALREAKRGHTYPLIARVSWCTQLTRGERQFIEDLLLKANGPVGKAEVRRTEKVLTRLHVEDLIAEGRKPAAAVRKVMRVRGHSRSYVFAARRTKLRGEE